MLYFFSQPQVSSIFNFSTFISALALLAIMYTVTDVRFRFRIAIAWVPLHIITYCLISFIGIGTLLTDLWFSENWPLPRYFPNHQSIYQSIFGALFFVLILSWIYYAVIRPPIFCKNNYKKFFLEFSEKVVKGSEDELIILSNELTRSVSSLIQLSGETSSRSIALRKKFIKRYKFNFKDYACDFLFLIANRKLCRYIISHSPTTAINFFQAMTNFKKYPLSIGEFSRNISEEIKISRLCVSQKRGILSVMDMHYLIVEKNQKMKHCVERHELAMFDVDRVLSIMKEEGLQSVFLKQGLMKERGLYIGVKK